jgi:hypothetical protein
MGIGIIMNRLIKAALPRTAAYSLMAGVALLAAPALAHGGGPGGLGIEGPETLEAGHFALDSRIAVTVPRNRSDAELEALAARHIHAHDSDYTLDAAIGAAYGVTDRLTLAAELPYVRRDGLRAGEHSHSGGAAHNTVVPLGSVAGIGDVSLLARYRLVDGVALVGGVKLPTGGTHARDRSGERFETEHQPGSGSVDPIAGAAFGAHLGWATLTGSALYQFSGRGAQTTDLGDRLHAGLELSHRFGPAAHHHDEADGHEAHEHHHASWDLFAGTTLEWDGRQRIAGVVEEHSGGTAVWLTPGVRYNSASQVSIAASVGVPVWQDIGLSHPENRVRLLLSVGKGF